jgi:radical SAM superfamily enzyme YgiQ (UPF0313 family)
MQITFLTPPSLDGSKPAERTAGCTRMVYPMPNIYELTVAALLEQDEKNDIFYRNFVLDNLSEQDFIDFLKKDSSNCYIFWSVNLSIKTDTQAQEYINQFNPEAYCIFLGPAASYFYSYFLTSEKSICVRGEPEYTVKELIECLSEKKDWKLIAGISRLDSASSNTVNNPPRPLIKNLDELPFPDIRFIEKYSFSNPKLKVSPYMAVVSSRNCPFKCIYCVPSSLTFAREIEYKKENNKKPPVGFRSVENVVEEIELLASKGYKAIGFMDDNFIVTKKRLKGIGEVLKKHGIIWGCQARVDAIDEEIAATRAERKKRQA